MARMECVKKYCSRYLKYFQLRLRYGGLKPVILISIFGHDDLNMLDEKPNEDKPGSQQKWSRYLLEVLEVGFVEVNASTKHGDETCNINYIFNA